MGIDISQIAITGGSIVVTAIITFLTTKHNLKEHTNKKFEVLKDLTNNKFDEFKEQNQKKFDNIKDKIHKQQLQISDLKSRDENQQQIIEVFQKQILDQLPKFYAIIENSTKKKKK